jgi:predicted nucleic acid-binding protein
MKLIITDVSVLFDLYQIKVLSDFFKLDLEICITIFVYNEILKEDQMAEFEVLKANKKLIILDLNEEEEIQVQQLKLGRNLKSFPDKTMIWKAIQLKCPLLTCDNKLRNEAQDHGIEVHGSIWVIIQLVKQNIIGKVQAIALLEQLKSVNVRLPLDEINQLIKQLK